MAENKRVWIFFFLLHGGWGTLAFLATALAKGIISVPISSPVLGILTFVLASLTWPYLVIFIDKKLGETK